VPENDIEKIFELLSIQSLEQVIEKLGSSNWSVIEIQELFSIAEQMGFLEYLIFDISIIRGLAYYTGVVFEAFDTSRKFRALFGGGRYNNLLSKLGGDILPCVGLGFGDVVISELLNDIGKTPGQSSDIDYAVAYMDKSSRQLALNIVNQLRTNDFKCDLSLKPEKPKAFFKKANRISALKAILIGSEEAQTGKFKVKDMVKGTSSEFSIDEFKSTFIS